MTEIKLELPEGDDLQDRIVDAAARQLLTRWTAGDGESEAGYEVPTELAREVEKHVLEEIKDQARAAVPEVAEEILARGVQQTNRWGDPSGERVPLSTIIADEVFRNLKDGQTGRSGKGVLAQLITREVEKQLKEELNAALEEAKATVVDALRERATAALKTAIADSVSGVKVK